MKKCFVLTLIVLVVINSNAQVDLCSQLNAVTTDFEAKTQTIIAIPTPSAAQLEAYTTAYLHYRNILESDQIAGMTDLVALATISSYAYVLITMHKNEESMVEIKFGYDHFLQNLARGSSSCYAAFSGTYGYSLEKSQHIVSTFYQMGTYTAIRLNDYSFAQKLLMRVDEREMLGNCFPNVDASAFILNYKVTRNEIDDSCFTAAYGYLISKYAALPKDRSLPVLLVDPMDIITNPRFINYKPARVKRYTYLDYHSYFSNLYMYQVDSNATEKEQVRTLKMFLQVYKAERNPNGVNQAFVRLLIRGANDSPEAILRIIALDDKELVQLLADFIDDTTPKVYEYTQMKLLYAGYLCYRHLGDGKKAGRLYKRIGKTRDERFKQLD